MTPNDWMLLASKLKRRTFQLGETIIREGNLNQSLFIIRMGEAAVEVAGTKSRTTLAMLGPDDICGDMAFLERGCATAAVVAKSFELEADEIQADDLREVFDAFPRLAARFYQSLAVILAKRLHDTSRELAREMAAADRCRQENGS